MDLEKIKAGLTGCSSHSCFIKPPVGMGTNGQCTCLDDKTKMQRYIFITNHEITSLREQLEIAKKDGWISVKDRLPEEHLLAGGNWTYSEKVIVFNSDGVNIQRFVNGDCFGNPTYWQPLKNPPKE